MSFLDSVKWQEAPPVLVFDDDLPHVTHEGVLQILDHTLRCYRLSDGRAIIHAEDFRNFFGDLGIEPASATPVSAELGRGA